jgi:hypothetical protein
MSSTSPYSILAKRLSHPACTSGVVCARTSACRSYLQGKSVAKQPKVVAHFRFADRLHPNGLAALKMLREALGNRFGACTCSWSCRSAINHTKFLSRIQGRQSMFRDHPNIVLKTSCCTRLPYCPSVYLLLSLVLIIVDDLLRSEAVFICCFEVKQ